MQVHDFTDFTFLPVTPLTARPPLTLLKPSLLVCAAFLCPTAKCTPVLFRNSNGDVLMKLIGKAREPFMV
jgi:hypothetical protein